MQKKTLGMYRFTPKLIRVYTVDEKSFKQCLLALENQSAYISQDVNFVSVMHKYAMTLNDVTNSVQLLACYKQVKDNIKGVKSSLSAMQFIMETGDERLDLASKLFIELSIQLSALCVVKYALQTIVLISEEN